MFQMTIWPSYAIGKKLLQVISYYLNARKSFVNLNGARSVERLFSGGLSQGPHLFFFSVSALLLSVVQIRYFWCLQMTQDFGVTIWCYDKVTSSIYINVFMKRKEFHGVEILFLNFFTSEAEIVPLCNLKGEKIPIIREAVKDPGINHQSFFNWTIHSHERIKVHIKWIPLVQCAAKHVRCPIICFHLSYLRPYFLYGSIAIASFVINFIQLENFQSRITKWMCCKSEYKQRPVPQSFPFLCLFSFRTSYFAIIAVTKNTRLISF